MKRLGERKAKDIWEMAEKRFLESRQRILDRMDTWLERAAFYRGKHYSVRHGVFDMNVDEPTGEEREVYNYIQSIVRSAVANRLKSLPNPEVPASTGDQTAMQRAEATEKLLKAFIDDDVFDREELIRALTWAQIAGGAWLKVQWDPNLGKLVEDEDMTEIKESEDPVTGQFVMDAQQKTDPFGVPVVSLKHEGQIRVEFVDTIDGIPDPAATRESEMRFWIHRKLRPTSALEEVFPADYFGKSTKGRFGKVQHEYETNTRDFLSGNDQNGSFGYHEGSEAEGEELVQLLEYWGMPTPEFPNGLLVVWSGTVLLHMGPNPYRPCRLPVVLFLGDNLVPGGLYADGVVDALIPLQRSLNRTETKKMEWINKAIVPHVLVPLGSNIDEDLFDEVGGQVIRYTPGLRPEAMQVPPIPGSLFDQKADVVNSMKEISTYSDISRGSAPSGIESGRAIAFLRENEQTIREPDIILHKRACLRVLWHCLMLAKQFYEEGRLYRSMGDEGWQVAAFKDEDFDWWVDLAPEAFSGAPSSRALRWAETMEAFTAGLFNDQAPGAKEARKLLGMDNANRSTIDAKRRHRSIARMENDQISRIAKGETIQLNLVREFHDDEIHLDEHNDLRNSLGYLSWTPEAQAQFDEHCAEHERNLQSKMQLFMQQQAPTGPAGPPPPAAPGMESPPTGGAPVGEPGPESQDEFIQKQVEQGQFSP